MLRIVDKLAGKLIFSIQLIVPDPFCAAPKKILLCLIPANYFVPIPVLVIDATQNFKDDPLVEQQCIAQVKAFIEQFSSPTK